MIDMTGFLVWNVKLFSGKYKLGRMKRKQEEKIKKGIEKKYLYSSPQIRSFQELRKKIKQEQKREILEEILFPAEPALPGEYDYDFANQLRWFLRWVLEVILKLPPFPRDTLIFLIIKVVDFALYLWGLRKKYRMRKRGI